MQLVCQYVYACASVYFLSSKRKYESEINLEDLFILILYLFVIFSLYLVVQMRRPASVMYGDLRFMRPKTSQHQHAKRQGHASCICFYKVEYLAKFIGLDLYNN